MRFRNVLTGTDLRLTRTQNRTIAAIRAIRVPNVIILAMVDERGSTVSVVCWGLPITPW
ncbi:MAG TPA: hypothetical protein V6D14_26470 [Coleofasciculaceae cyanobacterium]